MTNPKFKHFLGLVIKYSCNIIVRNETFLGLRLGTALVAVLHDYKSRSKKLCSSPLSCSLCGILSSF